MLQIPTWMELGFVQGTHNNNNNPPPWLKWFVNDAVKGIVHRADSAPIGCHFFHDTESDLWEVTLFVGRSEVVGGPWDGTVVPTGLEVDVTRVAAAFDVLPDISWQAEKVLADDELGPHISLCGISREQKIWFRILQNAPDWSGIGRVLHAESGDIEDRW
ncbi:MAG: hypothetical protein ACO3FE_10095 [Planctomycetaceae bacterium]